jgi:hypothetical protein
LNKGILPSSRGELIAQNVDFIVLQSLFDGFQVRHTYKVAPMMGIELKVARLLAEKELLDDGGTLRVSLWVSYQMINKSGMPKGLLNNINLSGSGGKVMAVASDNPCLGAIDAMVVSFVVKAINAVNLSGH